MLEKISLDESSYESVYENAMARIREAAPWWTHREASDPGITLLEMWSVLADMQSFYLDQVQDSHYRKYLKLLGIPLQEGQCASVWVSFEDIREDIRLPRGTKLTADKMVFETEEEEELTANSLCGFFMKKNQNKMDVMSLRRKTEFALDKGELLFSFALKKAVKAGEKLIFFVQLDERNKRNPLGESFSDQDFFMVQLVWEYRTAAGWREARIVRDDTRALLYSGRICLQMEDDMVSRGDSGYEIKCRIVRGSYDVMPVIYKISLNVVKVIQKNTLCCYEMAEFTGESHSVEMKSYLGLTGELRVMRLCRSAGKTDIWSKEVRNGKAQGDILDGEQRRKAAWSKALWQDITEKCVIDPPIKAVGQDRCVCFPEEGIVKIICTVPGAMSEYFPCAVSGVAAQRITFPWDNVMRGSVELMLAEREGSGLYRICRPLKEPEEVCSEYAWHWQEENEIVLGDGRHGEIPPAAGKGLLPGSLVLWEGSRGNISIGRIKSWENQDLFPKIKFTNLLTGSGGEDRMSPQEQFRRLTMQRERLTEENRMVTEADIQALVRKTPGLMIERAEAEWRDGTVVVTAFPVKPLNDEHCVEHYKICIQKHLEQYRLVGSRFRVEIAWEK